MDQNQQPQDQPMAEPENTTPEAMPATPAPEQQAPMGTPQPAPMAPQAMPAENPGQILGIIGIVATVLGVAIVGIVLGILSRNKSKAAGMSTTLGTVSLVLGIVATVLSVLFFVLFIGLGVFAAAAETSTY